MIKKIIAVLAAALFCAVSHPVFAADVAEQSGFSIISQPNELQASNQSYYDLKMQPGQTTILTLGVKNMSNVSSTYEITVNPAQTSDNVIIDYSSAGNAKGVGATPNLQIKSMTKLSTTQITVPANASKQFSVTLTMPDKTFDGIVAGAVRVERLTKNEKNGITNKFAYVKGIVVRQNDNAVDPALQINKIKVGQYHYLPGVIVTMANPTNINISKLKIDAKAVNDKTGETLNTKTVASGSVAPNSEFNYVIRYSKTIPAGKYHFVGTATNQKGHHWEWREPFTVKKAEKVANQPISVRGSFEWGWLLIVILLLIILALIWWIILMKRKKDHDDEE